MNDFQLLFDTVLDDGLDDWMMLANIVGSVRKVHRDNPDYTRDVAQELIRELVECGWMTPGDLGASGFEAWELTPSDAVQRILCDLEELGWDVSRNVVAWFDMTPKGLDRARENSRLGQFGH